MEEKKFIFDEIVDYLNSIVFLHTSSNGDARINSIYDEEEIIRLLKEKFPNNIIEGKKRGWYDMCVIEEDKKYPTNIKSSAKKGSDNASSNLSIIWTFTDIPFDDISSIRGTDVYVKSIKDRRLVSDRDYYYLVYDKETKTFFFNTLKSLNQIRANGSNPPFQIDWNKNKIRNYSSEEESYNKIIGCWKKSIESRRNQYVGIEDL